MGSRPGLAEYIASFEAANNAPHGFVLLLAGAAYALQALGDLIAERSPAPTPPTSWTPPSAGTRPSAPTRPIARPQSRRRARPVHLSLIHI